MAAGRAVGPLRRRARVAELRGADPGAVGGEAVEVRGWVKTVRAQKGVSFVELGDGSSVAGLQAVLNPGSEGWSLLAEGRVATGASVRVQGELVASPAKGQAVELRASALELLGAAPADYPLQKKRHSPEFLRERAHLRPRTNLGGAVARVRSALAFATHEFFHGEGFLGVNTPLISTSDCEGAGEMFQVTTLLPEPGPPPDLEALEAAVAGQGDAVRAAKAGEGGGGADVQEEILKLLDLKARLAEAEGASGGLPEGEDGGIDYGKDFFGAPAFLAVSGQLNAEAFACSMRDVYTFGPTFRAENSNTSRHLAEFWMVEPEMAFADLDDDMRLAQAYLKHCLGAVLDRCSEDLEFLDLRVEPGLLERLRGVSSRDFAAVTYTEAVELLQASGQKFEFPVEWGLDLQSEHERWLAEKAFGGTPVFVTDYPKDIKAFYMRLNDDGKTVAAMDLLVPGVGELIGGSQREERLEVLEDRLRTQGLDPEPYEWYLDLRRYGTVPHAGFGLGFERLVQYCTGVDNIRDTIAFPRYPGHASF